MSDFSIKQLLEYHLEKGGQLGNFELASKLAQKGELGGLIKNYIADSLPSESIVMGGIEILGTTRFCELNFEHSPAIFIRDIGFWTIMSTYGGDAFVLDDYTGRVLQVDPGMFCFRGGEPIGRGPNGRESVSRGFVEQNAPMQAASLGEFLDLIVIEVEK